MQGELKNKKSLTFSTIIGLPNQNLHTIVSIGTKSLKQAVESANFGRYIIDGRALDIIQPG